jgi:2-hydroxychromene-2-carboxylate isomerase
MAASIDFFFDFSSPFGYLASVRLEPIAAKHDREIVWRPYLMGAAMKVSGRGALVSHPLLNDYTRHDLNRCARLYGIPFRLPDPFPVQTVAACRAFYWTVDQDANAGKQLAQQLLRAYFIDNRNISDPDVVVSIGADTGLDIQALKAALTDPVIKERLRHKTDRAISLGVFGSPFIIVDGEAFWGNDRLEQVDRWLSTGGW